MLNEYVSKRLQIRLEESKNESKPAAESHTLNHASMIYTRLIDINTFVQILVESNLVSHDGDTYFVLPEPLRKFYLK